MRFFTVLHGARQRRASSQFRMTHCEKGQEKMDKRFKCGFVLLLVAVFLAPAAQAVTGLPQDYVKYPVMVSLDSGNSASGFYFNDNHGGIYLVTAAHVLFNVESGKADPPLRAARALLLSYPEEDLPEPVYMELDLNKLKQQGLLGRHPTEDAAAVLIGHTEGEGTERKIALSDGVQRKAHSTEAGAGTILGAHAGMTRSFDQVAIGNEVYTFGFPTSLGIEKYPQIDYKRPLLRKGIIAGKNPDKKTLILDCTTHHGNSGGPVIEVIENSPTDTSFWLIGMVTEYIPFENKQYIGRHGKLKLSNLENSGYSVVLPTDVILELVAGIPAHANPAQPAEKK